MLKKIILTSAMVILGGYMAFALTFLTREDKEQTCNGLDIEISGDVYGTLTGEEIKSMLEAKRITPTGKKLTEIDCSMIEQVISEYSLVERCECYKTHKGLIGIRISCKKPIMQVFDKYEKMFYIDAKGTIIEGVNCAIYIPVANGFIDRSMAEKELLEIATIMQEDEFWNEQIEQIYFTHKKEVILIPRVGNHTIELGKAEKIDLKLEKLKRFYEKGLNEVGWNKYKKLNIEFDGKVIGTKR